MKAFFKMSSYDRKVESQLRALEGKKNKTQKERELHAALLWKERGVSESGALQQSGVKKLRRDIV